MIAAYTVGLWSIICIVLGNLSTVCGQWSCIIIVADKMCGLRSCYLGMGTSCIDFLFCFGMQDI